jgi:hypothetical protein
MFDHVEECARNLTSWKEIPEDFWDGIYDIEWILDAEKRFKAAKLCVAFGGPNIFINTQTMQVEAFWWGESQFEPFEDNCGLQDYLQEIFSC